MFIIRDKGNIVILFGSLVHPLLINHFDIFDAITSYIACQCLFISFYYSCYYCKMLIRRKGMVLIMILIITIIVIIALDIILVLVTIYFCMFYHRPCCRCRVVLFV